MTPSVQRLGDERGIAVILALMVLLTLSGLALALLASSALEPRISRNLHDASRARWLTEAGIELGYGLLAGTAVEAYGTIVNATPYRRETVVADRVGRECSTGAPSTATCKQVRVIVRYRPDSGGGGPDQERRVDLVTVFVPRT